MTEQATNPTRESGPRTDWDIGKAMNNFFSPEEAVADDAKELEANAIPDEGKITDDEEVDVTDPDEDVDPDDEGTPADSFKLPLKVSGKEVVIESREEAIELAQKGLHYTQEMQKLRDREAHRANEHEQVGQRLHQQVEQYATALKTLEATYGFVLGKNAPDWSSDEMQRLKAEKPQEYLQIREQWDQLGAIRGELSRIDGESQKESQKKWGERIANEQAALAEKRPEWTDAARRQQDWSMIRDYATSQGIAEQEIGNLYDHRFWLILHDAARYRQAETAGRKKRETVTTKVVEPGQGRNVNQGDRRLRAERDRLATTGDVRAAGNIFQDIMTRKK